MRRSPRIRILGACLALLCTGLLAMCASSNDHDLARWHVDLAGAERTGRPNDAFAAPAGTTAATPDIALELRAGGDDPLGAFAEVAEAAPRTERIAGDLGSGRITWVQRSAVFGFPDYVTAQRVETPAGPSLAVWSRARYGYSDLGVNRARLEDWLGQARLL